LPYSSGVERHIRNRIEQADVSFAAQLLASERRVNADMIIALTMVRPL
jgi:hypothetical protein